MPAVSYTHLDVYKRQVLLRLCAATAGWERSVKRLSIERILLCKYRITPVSYTHLDVYKRQGIVMVSHTDYVTELSVRIISK